MSHIPVTYLVTYSVSYLVSEYLAGVCPQSDTRPIGQLGLVYSHM